MPALHIRTASRTSSRFRRIIYVGFARLEDGDPLFAPTESESVHLFRVVLDGAKDIGMYHAASEYLEPAAPLANPAPLARADDAPYVNLGARLGKREKTRTESHPCFFSEHAKKKLRQNPLQIGECYSLIDHEPFHLMEHGRMGYVGIPPVNRARRYYAKRGLAGFHDPYLNRRRVSPQKKLLFEIKGVLHVSRGMVFGNVEGLEVIIIRLDLRAFGYVETHGREYVFYLLHDGRYRMQGSGKAGVPRQRHVEALFFEASQFFNIAVLAFESSEGLFYSGLYRVYLGSGLGALFRKKGV